MYVSPMEQSFIDRRGRILGRSSLCWGGVHDRRVLYSFMLMQA